VIEMAILRLEEIRKMSRADRSARLIQLKAELLQMNATKAMGGSLENPARIRLLRKTIAKILTINREEDLGIRAQPAEEPKEEKGKKGEAKAEGEVKEKGKEKEEARARKAKKGKETETKTETKTKRETEKEEEGKEGESD